MAYLFSIFAPLILLCLASIGVGALVLSRFVQRERHSTLAELCLAMLLGQGIYGAILLAPALGGIFTVPVVLLLTVPFAIFGLFRIYQELSSTGTALHGWWHDAWKAPLHWKLVSFLIVLTLLLFSASVSGMVEGDALAFYLTLPKTISASHRLIPLPGYEPFMNVGLTAEIQLAALYLLGMPGTSVKLYIWLTTLAGAVMLMAIGKSAGLGRKGRILALGLLATSSAIIILLEGKTDFFAAAYALCAVLFALDSWNENVRRTSQRLAGLFLGIALVAKLSYAVAFLPSLFLLIFYQHLPTWKDIRHDRRILTQLLRTLIIDGFYICAFAAIAFVPHFIKNLILVGEFTGMTGSFKYFTAETTRHIVTHYPLVLTFGRYWAQLGNISPLILAFLPLALLLPTAAKTGRSKNSALLVSGMLGLVCWVALFPAVPIPRYLLATLLMLFIPAALAAERFSRMSKLGDYVLAFSLAFTVVVINKSWSFTVYPVQNAINYFFLDQHSKEIGKTLNPNEAVFREVFESINKIAKPGERVYLASYFRFWFRPDLIQTSNTDDENTIIKELGDDSEAIWRLLKEHNFAYIYMDGGQRWKDFIKSPPSWVTVEELYPLTAPQGKGYGSAYRISFHDAPVQTTWKTVEVAPGAWNVIPTD